MLGAVKSVIGLLEGVAGMASLTKAVRVLQDGAALPNLRFTEKKLLLSTRWASPGFSLFWNAAHAALLNRISEVESLMLLFSIERVEMCRRAGKDRMFAHVEVVE